MRFSGPEFGGFRSRGLGVWGSVLFGSGGVD